MTHSASPSPAPPISPQEWLETPQGRYVLDLEAAKLSETIADEFGYNALQLGLPERNLLANNRMPLRQIVSDRAGTPARLRAEFTALPVPLPPNIYALVLPLNKSLSLPIEPAIKV